MTVVAQAFTRSGALYTMGIASVVPFAMVSLAITTRYLGVSGYGQLATLFAIASVLTVVSGIGVIQGVLMVVYRAADEDGDAEGDGLGDAGGGDVVEVDEQRIDLSAAEKRRLLGSGLILILVTSTALCGTAALLSPIIANVFLGSGASTDSVLWMAASAWTGSVWRLAHQIWRLERHPVIWSLFQALRPFLVVLGTLLALGAGMGLNGVLAASTVGTASATVVSLAFSRRSFTVRPRRGDARRIMSAGMKVAPLIVARVIQGNVSILLLALIAPPASVGLFQAASRIAQIPSFFASGFIIGWIPLNNSPIGAAGRDLRGRSGYGARLFTLLVLILVGLTVAISLASGAAIRLAAPSFGRAADLIPIVAVGLALFEVFHAYYRASGFRHRQWWYTALLFIWLFPYAAAISLGGALSPTYAVAAGQVVASGFVLAALAWLDRRGNDPLPVPWLRLMSVVSVAAACVAAAQLAGASGVAGLVLALVAIVGFPLVLRATGLLSRAETMTGIAVFSSLVRLPMSGKRFRQRMEALHPAERQALVAVGWQRRPVEHVAGTLGVSNEVVGARVVSGLRAFMGSDSAPTPSDGAIGRFLLDNQGAVHRDLMAESLGRSGVSLVELHELDEALQLFRRLRRRGLRWLRSEAPHHPGDDQAALLGGGPAATNGAPTHPDVPQAVRELVLTRLSTAPTRESPKPATSSGDRRVADGLCSLSGTRLPEDQGLLVVRFLAERSESRSRALWAAGVDPLAVHRMELALEELRRSE